MYDSKGWVDWLTATHLSLICMAVRIGWADCHTFISYLCESKAWQGWLPYICLLFVWEQGLGELTAIHLSLFILRFQMPTEAKNLQNGRVFLIIKTIPVVVHTKYQSPTVTWILSFSLRKMAKCRTSFAHAFSKRCSFLAVLIECRPVTFKARVYAALPHRSRSSVSLPVERRKEEKNSGRRVNTWSDLPTALICG